MQVWYSLGMLLGLGLGLDLSLGLGLGLALELRPSPGLCLGHEHASHIGVGDVSTSSELAAETLWDRALNLGLTRALGVSAPAPVALALPVCIVFKPFFSYFFFF